MNTITSYGIALVKKNKSCHNKLNNIYEILFIKKRLSYAYISFIRGVYYKNKRETLMELQ